MLHPNQFRYFLAIVETGSFRQAARRLSVTQAAVSLAMKGLEDYLGQALFVREKNRTILTAAGHDFVPWAEKYREDQNRLREHFRQRGQSSRPLQIGIARSQIDAVLPWMEKLVLMEPDICLNIQTGTGLEMRELLRNGQLDVAITINVGPDEELWDYPDSDSLFLLRDELLLICADNSLCGRELSLADLSVCEWILTDSSRSYLQELFDEQNLPLNVRVQCDTARIIPRLLRHTKALSLLPKQSIAPSLGNGLFSLNCPRLHSSFRIQASFQANPSIGNPGSRAKLWQILAKRQES